MIKFLTAEAVRRLVAAGAMRQSAVLDSTRDAANRARRLAYSRRPEVQARKAPLANVERMKMKLRRQFAARSPQSVIKPGV